MEVGSSDASSEGSRGYLAFTDSVLPYLFNQKLGTMPPSRMRPAAAKLFLRLFVHMNTRSKAIKWVQPDPYTEGANYRQAMELKGEDTLWEIALHATDDAVADSVMHVLVDLQHRLSSKLKSKSEKLRGQFVHTCLRRMSNAVPYMNVGGKRIMSYDGKVSMGAGFGEAVEMAIDGRVEGGNADTHLGGDPTNAEMPMPAVNPSFDRGVSMGTKYAIVAERTVSRCVILLQRFLDRFHGPTKAFQTDLN